MVSSRAVPGAWVVGTRYSPKFLKIILERRSSDVKNDCFGFRLAFPFALEGFDTFVQNVIDGASRQGKVCLASNIRSSSTPLKWMALST